MATKDLSLYDRNSVPPACGMRFGIVVSEWNETITDKLREGAVSTLLRHGVSGEDISVKFVPGSFELPLGAKFFAEQEKVDAILCLGAVVRGGTPHFEYVCQGVTQGIMQVNMQYGIPVIFGVLTTDDQQQALDRAGGKLGNKGDEAAVTAIKMAALKKSFL